MDLALALCCLCLLCCSTVARAQTAPTAPTAPSVADLEQRLADQEARLREQDARLKQQEERLRAAEQTRLVPPPARLAAPEAAPAAPKAEPLFGFGSDGLYFGYKEFLQIRLRGIVQADARAYFDTGNQPIPDQFLIRRARPIVEGTVADLVDFKIVPDFGQGAAVLQDAYLDFRPWRFVALRVGKFKDPFGLERLQNDANLAFAERGLTSDLVPDRDIGASLHGDFANGSLLYEAGVFDGALENNSSNQDGDTNDGKDGVFRLFAHPFRVLHSLWVRDLGLGVAATYGKQHGSAALPGVGPFKTTGQIVFFSYLFDPTAIKPTVIAISDRYRVSPQLYWYVGPVGLLSEYVYDAVTVTNNLDGSPPRKTLAHQAWQVELQVVVTGENTSFNGVRPKRPFNLRKLHFGALELAARYGGLRVDPATFPTYADPTKSANFAQEWGVGFNWYLLDTVKVVVDFERTTFHGGAPMNGDRRPENFLVGRAQLSF